MAVALAVASASIDRAWAESRPISAATPGWRGYLAYGGLLAGRDSGWESQRRDDGTLPWPVLARRGVAVSTVRFGYVDTKLARGPVRPLMISVDRAVEVLVREGPERVRELMELGVRFTREHGDLSLGLEGGHSRRRIVRAGIVQRHVGVSHPHAVVPGLGGQDFLLRGRQRHVSFDDEVRGTL